MPRIKQLVNTVSLTADRIAPPPAGITILIYHRVGGGTDSAVDLDPDDFDRQLAHLVEHHRVLSLDDAVSEFAAAQPEGWAVSRAPAIAEPGVVVTFDDGTADFEDVVLPALVRHGVPATLYVATQFVDSGEAFPWGAPPVSWPAIADALSSGLVTVGSHTHSHGLLDRLPADDVERELDRSIELIGEHLGVTAEHFAYPKAVGGSPAAEVAVRRRFASAALARNRVNRPGRTDLHRLWRTPIQRSDAGERFAMKASGGFRLEGELRHATAGVRYRGQRS